MSHTINADPSNYIYINCFNYPVDKAPKKKHPIKVAPATPEQKERARTWLNETISQLAQEHLMLLEKFTTNSLSNTKDFTITERSQLKTVLRNLANEYNTQNPTFRIPLFSYQEGADLDSFRVFCAALSRDQRQIKPVGFRKVWYDSFSPKVIPLGEELKPLARQMIYQNMQDNNSLAWADMVADFRRNHPDQCAPSANQFKNYWNNYVKPSFHRFAAQHGNILPSMLRNKTISNAFETFYLAEQAKKYSLYQIALEDNRLDEYSCSSLRLESDDPNYYDQESGSKIIRDEFLLEDF